MIHYISPLRWFVGNILPLLVFSSVCPYFRFTIKVKSGTNPVLKDVFCLTKFTHDDILSPKKTATDRQDKPPELEEERGNDIPR